MKRLLLAPALATLLVGCGLDHTGRSATYLMESRIDANKARARSLERDLQLERTRVDEMEEVYQVEPLSMSWCLDCHRDPAPHLRPLEQVTNMRWNPPPDQGAFALQAITERDLKPPVDCTGCHR